MKSGIVILNYKDSITTINLCNNIEKYKDIHKIVVVDNLSPDDSFQKLEKLKNKKIDVIQSDYNGGYSYGNNFGARYLINNYNIDIVFICNPDVIFSNEHIHNISECLKNNNIEAAAGLMLNPDGTLSKWSGKMFTFLESLIDSTLILRRMYFKSDISYAKHEYPFVYVDFLPGSLFAIKADVFLKIGGFDENVFLYFEESILRKKFDSFGYRMALLETESFIHNHSVSINKALSKLNQLKIYYKSKEYFLKKYCNYNNFQVLLIKALDLYGYFVRFFVYKLIYR